MHNMKHALWGTPIRFIDHHVPRQELEEMRYKVDTLGDECLLALREKGITVQDFISKLKDTDISCYDDPRMQAFAESVLKIPGWLDWEQVKYGQYVYLKHYGSASLGLLYVSLIGGFAAPKITKVLDATGYMTKDEDITYRRMFETFEMVLDCMDGDDALEVGNRAFNSVLKVRFLHSRVRLNLLGKIKKTAGSTDTEPSETGGGCPFHQGFQNQTQNYDIVPDTPSNASNAPEGSPADTFPHLQAHSVSMKSTSEKSSRGWDSKEYGLPINQEDMVVTLLSFSAIVLDTIHKTAARGSLTLPDEEAYLHLWRYIGHLIGVDGDLNPCTSKERSGGTMESIILHILTPDDRSGVLARHLILAQSNRRPLNWSYEMHSEMARALLGDDMANALGLERDLKRWIYARFALSMTTLTSMISQPLFTPNNERIQRLRRILRFTCNSVLYPERNVLLLKEQKEKREQDKKDKEKESRERREKSFWPLTGTSTVIVCAGLSFPIYVYFSRIRSTI